MSLNKLSINYAKSMYLLTGKKIQSNLAEDFVVTLGNHQIKREQSVKYLGVIVDEKLNWSSHLKQIETKLAFASSVIYKTRNILPLSKKIHMSVPCLGLKPNWLSVVAKSGEMHDKM